MYRECFECSINSQNWENKLNFHYAFEKNGVTNAKVTALAKFTRKTDSRNRGVVVI